VILMTSSAFVFAMIKTDNYGDKIIKEKQNNYSKNETQTAEESGYDLYFQEAQSETQIEQLQKLKNDTSLGIGEWKRESLKIIGRIPKNQKRLTLESTNEIIKDLKTTDTNDIINSFNEIAGAPDWEGGSGISRTIYFTDETKKESIQIIFDDVKHIYTDKEGKQVAASLLGNKIISSPATTQPNEFKS